MKFFIPLLGLIGFSLQIANGQSNTYEYYKPQGAAATNQQQPLADSRADNYYYNQDTASAAAAYQNYDTASAYSTQNFQQIDRQVFDDLGPLLPIYLIAGAGFMGAAAALIQASDGRREVQDRINLNRGILNSIAPQVPLNKAGIDSLCTGIKAVASLTLSSPTTAFPTPPVPTIPTPYQAHWATLRTDLAAIRSAFNNQAPTCVTTTTTTGK